MAIYIVTFEISDVQKYKGFVEKLQTFVGYCPIHKNAWAISTDKKAGEIIEYLKGLIDTDDRVFVIKSGTEASWFNSYGTANSEWLKKFL